MDIISQLTEWSQALLPEHLFLVEVEQKQGAKKISVYIDGDKGVTIEDCRLLAKGLNAKLDELDYGTEAYMFEVSSPGTDRPLKLKRQYPQHIGRELLVKLTGNNEILGKFIVIRVFRHRSSGHNCRFFGAVQEGYPSRSTLCTILAHSSSDISLSRCFLKC
jgi:ribosome maturation factor RimP